MCSLVQRFCIQKFSINILYKSIYENTVTATVFKYNIHIVGRLIKVDLILNISSLLVYLKKY